MSCFAVMCDFIIQTFITIWKRGEGPKITSQKRVSLSSGSSPFASSRRKSLRINFLKPQSLPWTNLYALWLSGMR